MRTRKIIATIVFSLVMLGVIGLVIHEYITTKTVESGTVIKALLIIAGGILSIFKIFNGMGGKIPYQKYEAAYAKELANTFVGDSNKKERKELLEAIHLFNLKLYDRAIASLEKLLKKCQTSGDVYGVKLFMALSYEGTKSGYKAMEIYQEMIRQGTVRPTPYINLGVLYEKEDKLSNAVECFYEAIRLDPTDYHSYNNLAQVLAGNDEFEEAIECAQKALELKNNFNDCLEVLALSYNALGDYENAEKYFTKCLKTGSNEQKLRRVMNIYKDTGIEKSVTEDDDNIETDNLANEDTENE